jgi:hypothetical protein
MSAVVQFVTAADHALETEERLTDLVDHLVELSQRLDTLEACLVEAAGADPLSAILARLDAFETRVKRLERHLRRPPAFPISVIENRIVGPDLIGRMDDLSRSIATECHERTGKITAHAKALDAFNQRLDRCADQFCRMRERLAVVEARIGDDKRGATP